VHRRRSATSERPAGGPLGARNGRRGSALSGRGQATAIAPRSGHRLARRLGLLLLVRSGRHVEIDRDACSSPRSGCVAVRPRLARTACPRRGDVQPLFGRSPASFAGDDAGIPDARSASARSRRQASARGQQDRRQAPPHRHSRRQCAHASQARPGPRRCPVAATGIRHPASRSAATRAGLRIV
jgi:hypothetical protein